MMRLRQGAHALATLLLAALVALFLEGCGGGGPVQIAAPGVVGTGPTAVTVGTISGFGSIIVNGVEFDDAGAAILDDAGRPRSRGDLKLGMVIELRGSVDDATRTGRASSIRIVSGVRGAVQAVDVPSGTLRVLGNRVRVSAQTVYDGLVGLSALKTGDKVEVSGYFDATSDALIATRVARAASVPDAEQTTQGVVAALDAKARRFRLGTLTVDYGGAKLEDLKAGLADGTVVQVTGTLKEGDLLVATRVEGEDIDLGDADKGSVEGEVSGFVSVARFRVDGFTVDASDASFTGGRAGDLANGVRVRVEGELRGGVLVATSVEIRRPDGGEAEHFELKGVVANFVSVSDFEVKGQRVDASAATFEDGTASDLANGVSVRIEGRLSGTAGGAVLLADEVRFTR